MKTVKIKDKEFSLSIKADDINTAVSKIAKKINKDYKDKNPVFLVILNGSFMFASDLFKKLDIQCEISFLKVASYHGGTTTTGKVKTLIGLTEDIKDRSVIIVEDIVDTGHTINELFEILIPQNPSEIKICTLLFKPDAYKGKIILDYIGFEIPNDFIVGYGLDYDGFGRNLGDIYKIIE
ncbi:MAG: hypoxanthine phosphoribosyltransferase [Bacteroidetes bacterium]|nr:hypoxanthine phosphoribosyltransferase [Bacteroidota bacterium]